MVSGFLSRIWQRTRFPAFAVAVFGVLCVLSFIAPAWAGDETPAFRACLDPDNLPFSARADAAGGQDRGYYVELAKAIAADLGRPFEPVWYVMRFARHAVGEELLSGKCDAFFALPQMPGAAGPQVIFSQPILRENYALVTEPGHEIRRLDDLDGHKVAVLFSSPPQSWLAERGGVSVVTEMDSDGAMVALAEGKVDVAMIWGPSAGFLNQSRYHGRFAVVPLAGPGMEFEAAIGFDARHGDLRDEVDQALVREKKLESTLLDKYGFPRGAPIRLSMAVLRYRLVADNQPGNSGSGREIINAYCAHCHGVDARAPATRQNLHLLQQRYGDNMDQVFMTTVHHGRPDKGMPNWSGVLTEDQFKDVLAYLKSSQD
jgi:ABC-type amino acid transport substrate-binding protein